MKANVAYGFVFIVLVLTSFGFVFQELNNFQGEPIQFSISLSGAKGDFLVLYHRNKSESYAGERMIKRRIVGDGIIRIFDYEFPEETSNVRIDLSENANQEQLIIENITIKDAKGNSKIIKDKQLRQLRFNPYCHNFEVTEHGLSFNTQTIGTRYTPQIEDLNIPYLLYYAR